MPPGHWCVQPLFITDAVLVPLSYSPLLVSGATAERDVNTLAGDMLREAVAAKTPLGLEVRVHKGRGRCTGT